MANQSRRTQIANKLVSIFGAINTSVLEDDGITPKYHTDVKHCQRKLVFIDEVESIGTPSIYVTAASESRQYNPARTAVKHILFIVRGYINAEVDSDIALDNLIEDVEVAMNESYNINNLDNLVADIRIVEITSDEGLLSPDAVFEMILDATLVEGI